MTRALRYCNAIQHNMNNILLVIKLKVSYL